MIKRKTSNLLSLRVLGTGEAGDKGEAISNPEIASPSRPLGTRRPSGRPPLDRLASPPKGAPRTGSASATDGNDSYRAWIERALDQVLSSKKGMPSEIHDAMRYAVLNGGKRFRPCLVLAACEAVGGNPRQALVPASAVELIHAYSLVHDDLPALDNDDFRRGKPTCHRKFGEALAILTGDALLTRAFQLLSEFRPDAKANCMIRELADAVGTRGMIGGQVADILWAQNGSAKNLDASRLDFISRNKTGRLIQVSAVIGAVVGTGSRSKIDRMRRFGSALGLAFQVVDDIMDGDGYLKLMDPTRARQKAEDLIRRAKQEAEGFGKKGNSLMGLADFLYQRARSTDVLPVDIKN